ncbi:hypothetical protein GN244_ATG01941 [Phytophthora infestans]|uniref:Uncharacterized protein n=1 Tax=Phytophthora infestans TaxID=4787 RepID=A0A833TFJ5_PHYIN|nr:hypothetical protein GN244_ATG01939 [Phytophthora infestans]KAF4045766.1 hypothetical protein GN244_ATG01941 [Phytophthora infestans]KAF4139934.1 hypothetical protein GN958_ATG10923 [Phytophthora infestans]
MKVNMTRRMCNETEYPELNLSKLKAKKQGAVRHRAKFVSKNSYAIRGFCFTYLNKVYSVKSYAEASMGVAVQLPLDQDVKRDKETAPPLFVSKRGRPRKKRISAESTYRCYCC